VIDPEIAGHHGRVVKTSGDGLLGGCCSGRIISSSSCEGRLRAGAPSSRPVVEVVR
jgi:hypothetical protein